MWHLLALLPLLSLVALSPVWALRTSASVAFHSLHLVSARDAWGYSQGGVYRTHDGGRHWQNRTPALTSGGLLEGGALDARHAWFTVSRAGEGPRLYRTRDGGVHWTWTRLFRQGSARVAFRDSQYGTAVVQLDRDRTHSAFVVLTSRDAGAHWGQVNSARPGHFRQALLQGGDLPDVSGLNDLRIQPGGFGLACGLSGPDQRPYVWQTRDGGRTFRDVAGQLPYAPAERRQFSSTRLAWSAGPLAVLLSDVQAGAPNERHVARLFRTEDAGRHWHTPAPLALPVHSGAALPAFADARHGWVWVRAVPDDQGQPGVSQLWRTGNGGENWRLLTPPFAATAAELTALSFADPQHGLAALRLGAGVSQLWRTDDAGEHWTQLDAS